MFMSNRKVSLSQFKACVLGIFLFCSVYRTFVRMCQIGGDGTEHQNPYKTQAEISWSPREEVLAPLVGPSRPTFSEILLFAAAFLK